MVIRRSAGSRSIDRLSAIDLMEFASDVGPAPFQVGAILSFEPGSTLALSAVRAALAERVCGIARLRQRLVRTPFGCGRPIWVDDPAFDISRHVREVRCSSSGGQDALLREAAAIAVEPLPSGQPLWSATLVTGLAENACALVVVFHHVLADGMGGLAVLAGLADGMSGSGQSDFPRQAAPWWQLATDALAGRVRVLGHLPGIRARLSDALSELRPGTTPRAPRCSLNRPVGPRRRLGVARADLNELRSVGHAHGATINDAVITAVGGALRALLAHRGESAGQFVVSVPVSGRPGASADRLGNQIGVIPFALPACTDPFERLEAIAAISREHKTGPRAASATVLAPVFRALAWLGVLRWLIERQHLVTTFVTNLRGPCTRLSFLGTAIAEVIPLNAISGNVAIAFAALSYAGTLLVTAIVDADAFPDAAVLVDALQRELDALTLRAGA